LGARAERGLLPAKLIELLLVGLIFAGSLILVGIPLATPWLVSRVSGEYATIYLLALTGCPLTLIAWGIVLTRLNRFLTRLRGAPARSWRRVSPSRSSSQSPRWRSGSPSSPKVPAPA
jgi:hypothetical protein